MPIPHLIPGRRARVVAAIVLAAAATRPLAAQAPRASSSLAQSLDSAAPAPLIPVLPADRSPLGRLAGALARRGVVGSVQVVTDVSSFAGPDGPSASAMSPPSRGRSLTTATASADLGQLLGVPLGRLSASLGALAGPDQTATLGAIHGGTSIDAAPFRGIGEVWYEQASPDDGFRLKIGRVDASTEFGAVGTAAGFLTPAMGLDPTIFPIPTYPTPSLGANAFARLSRRVRVGLGVYDGDPAFAALTGEPSAHALFGIGQVELSWAGTGGGRVETGAWRHTGRFADPLGDATSAHGAYALVEQALIPATADQPRALGAYLQLGYSPSAASDVARHLGAGLALAAPLTVRDADSLGVALSIVTLGQAGAAARGARVGATEQMLELFYAARLTTWLTVVPDFQTVLHTGGRASRTPATAFTLRTVLSR